MTIHSPLELLYVLGFRVSYHPYTTRDMAESLLTKEKIRTYLLRDSWSNPGDLVLSVK